jgi:hypothetical protein
VLGHDAAEDQQQQRCKDADGENGEHGVFSGKRRQRQRGGDADQQVGGR